MIEWVLIGMQVVQFFLLGYVVRELRVRNKRIKSGGNQTVLERWVLEQRKHAKGSPKWTAMENRLKELRGGD